MATTAHTPPTATRTVSKIRGWLIFLGIALLLIGIAISKGGLLGAAPRMLVCEDGYDRLPSIAREVVVQVPPSNRWTRWQVRPATAPAFWISPDADLDVEKAYGDGASAEIRDTPLLRSPDGKFVTGARFRNPGRNPVTVRIRLRQ